MLGQTDTSSGEQKQKIENRNVFNRETGLNGETATGSERLRMRTAKA